MLEFKSLCLCQMGRPIDKYGYVKKKLHQTVEIGLFLQQLVMNVCIHVLRGECDSVLSVSLFNST